MSKFDDETLMAFADGELEPRSAAAVSELIGTDEVVRKQVDSLRRTAALAREAFDDVLHAPVPDRLITAVHQPQDNVVVMRRPKDSVGDRVARLLPMAVAACITVVAVGSLSHWLMRDGSMGDVPLTVGAVAPKSQLAHLLETQASGATLQLSGSTSQLSAVATYRDKTGRVCREVEVTSGRDADTRRIAAGVACRAGGSGSWTVEGVAHVAEASAARDPSYMPSGADEHDLIRGLLDRLGANAAVAPDEERRLLDSRWQR